MELLAGPEPVRLALPSPGAALSGEGLQWVLSDLARRGQAGKDLCRVLAASRAGRVKLFPVMAGNCTLCTAVSGTLSSSLGFALVPGPATLCVGPVAPRTEGWQMPIRLFPLVLPLPPTSLPYARLSLE